MQNTVLIVEDEDNIAVALDFLLRRAGHAPRRVASGARALEAIRADPPDLVLLDLMLPDRGGDEVCRSVRRDPALDAVRVVLMSASPGAAGRSEACGADAFLAKPFANEAVERTVRRLLPPAKPPS